MANIKELDLRRIDQGQYQQHFFQSNIVVPQGIGNESDAVRVILADKINVHFTAGTLYESLSAESDIINDTALWLYVSSSAQDVFQITAGASYLKVVNDGTEDSIFNITGV